MIRKEIKYNLHYDDVRGGGGGSFIRLQEENKDK